MLELLQPWMRSSSPRIINPWVEYVNNLNTYKTPLHKRFMLAPDYETMGMQLIRYMLNFIDYSYLERHYTNDFDRYTFHVRFVKEDIENIFDQVSTGRSFYNYFINNNLGKIPEYILPCEDVTSIQTLPMNGTWDDWLKVQPIQILEHDSDEFTLNLFNDRVKFTKDIPSYSIITIDIVALVFKYFKYKTLAPEDPEYGGKDERRFIHKHLIVPMMDQLIDIFLINQFTKITSMTMEEIEDIDISSLTYEPRYGFVGHRYKEACKAVHRDIMKISSGNIKPPMLLNSALLLNEQSITSRCDRIITTMDIPDLRQYQYYTYLRDRKLFKLVTNLYMVDTDNQVTKSYMRNIKPHILKLIRNRIWNGIKDKVLANEIETELNELHNTLSYT